MWLYISSRCCLTIRPTVKQSHNILLTLWIHWGSKKNKVGVITGVVFVRLYRVVSISKISLLSSYKNDMTALTEMNQLQLFILSHDIIMHHHTGNEPNTTFLPLKLTSTHISKCDTGNTIHSKN